jgi:A/G-specific adenine glycosylase
VLQFDIEVRRVHVSPWPKRRARRPLYANKITSFRRDGDPAVHWFGSRMIALCNRKKIQRKLLDWFHKHGRDLPWRKTRNPYAIWVSEIMLQQTQVATVIPYYQRFLRSFPTIHHLAGAALPKVLKAWEGLGYYSRARNLHRFSRIVSNHFHGRIPDNLRELLSLPGIGRYTAGAILSIAYNKEAPILDGNVKRVLSRLFAVSGDSVKKKTDVFLWKISESLVPMGRSRDFNQALMDLGAMVCTPKGPQCNRCPLANDCKARVLGKPEQYPAKVARKAIPVVEAVSAVVKKRGQVLLRQRPPEGLLGGLWEFPNWKIEEKRKLRLGLELRSRIKKEMGMNVEVMESIGTFHHAFTHFKLTLHVFLCETMDESGQGKWVSARKLDRLAMPRLHRKIADLLVRSSES